MNSNRSASTPSNLLKFLDPEIILGIATAPLLAAIVGGSALSKAVQELGEMSEEIFRGDRLPILEFPNPTHQTEASN